MDCLSSPVLIVGAGPVGLALAIELGSRGHRCLLIERNDRVGYAPRAKTTHIRTRQHLRRWGIADKLASAAPFGIGYPSNVVYVTRLAAEGLARFADAFNCAPVRNDLYCEHAQWIPQYRLEEVLREHLTTLPSVQVRFSCELLSVTDEADGVSSQVRDLTNGATFEVRTAFLVGADGSRSRVREIIGARMEGTHGLSRNYNIVFRAPGLANAHGHGPAVMYWQVNSDMPSLIGPMDRDDKWFFMPTAVPPGVRLNDQEAGTLIRRTTGIDLPYEVLSTDEWVASRFIADRYQRGRVFLAGDACHLHPPFGGYGMNMGIADGVDLGWKLGAVLEGWGGPALLGSYEMERRPLHQQVIEEAAANHGLLGNQLWREGLEGADSAGAALRREVGAIISREKTREFQSLPVVLGYGLGLSEVIAAEGPPLTLPKGGGTYQPSARPGCLAPHVWVDADRALYDLFGPGFTLLSTTALPRQVLDRIRADAGETGIPLRILVLPDARYGALYDAPLILVRPDQHVAWRGAIWPGTALLRRVAGWSVAVGKAPGADVAHRI
jgi:2-polyprenyl-6-methoxyphenol hydroxylase-like FAD-dependent oxidoreductase